MSPATEQQPLKVLAVDDSPDVLAMFVRCLNERGHACTPVATGQAAMSLLASEPFDLMFADVALTVAAEMALLTHAAQADPAPLVVVMTRYTELETALKAVQSGAYDLMTKPFTPAEMAVRIDNLSALVHLQREHDALVRELADAYRVIAHLSEADRQPSPQAPQEPATDTSSDSSAGLPADPPPAATVAPTAPVVPPTVPPVPTASRISMDAIAAYRSVAWAPDRSARRLWAMYQQGTITREEYDRLSSLAPHDLPTA